MGRVVGSGQFDPPLTLWQRIRLWWALRYVRRVAQKDKHGN